MMLQAMRWYSTIVHFQSSASVVQVHEEAQQPIAAMFCQCFANCCHVLSMLRHLACRGQGGDMLDWTSDNGIQEDVFLQRIEALSTMGYSVLLSNYRRYFKLAAYLSTFTHESIVIAMGAPSLKVGSHMVQRKSSV